MTYTTPDGDRSGDSQHARRPLRLRGLKAQIVLWTVLPLTLVLIGVAFTGVYSHEQSMRALVQERDQALAVVSASQVRDLLGTRVAALEAVASQQVFLQGDVDRVSDVLKGAANPGGLFEEGVVLLDESGNPAWPTGGLPEWIGDERIAGLARSVMARQGAAFGQLSGPLGGVRALIVGVPVYDETGAAYAVLVAPVSVPGLGLERVLGQALAGEQAGVYLVDAQGEILARSPAGRTRSSLAGHTGLDVALEDDAAGATLCRAPDGERMTLAYAPVELDDIGWRVLIEEPWREVVGPVLRYSQFMPLVAVLAAVVSLLTLYYGVRSIVRPLQALGERAERVAWGDFSATGRPVGGVEEIEDLRRTLDQMAGRIQSYQSGMHDYIAAITQGQEEERKRLARELHDDTAQALIALSQQVDMTRNLLVTDPERAIERLSRMRAMLGETLEGVRRVSRELRPIYLDDLGFIPALEMLAREADQNGQLSVSFSTTGEVRRLPPDLELAAYRIVQEALNNAIQHAQATRAWVEVRFEAEHLVLLVGDNGQGFESPALPDALAQRGHFGLMGIQERSLLYGGRLTLDSTPGEGTQVTVLLPYPTRAEGGEGSHQTAEDRLE